MPTLESRSPQEMRPTPKVFQELIAETFLAFVAMGVAMATAPATRKNREGSHCHWGHLSLPWGVIPRPCSNLQQPNLLFNPQKVLGTIYQRAPALSLCFSSQH